jgi:hypothetical protein
VNFSPHPCKISSHMTFPGLLAVGSQCGLSVYTLILDNDLLTWSQKWMSRYMFLLPQLLPFLNKFQCYIAFFGMLRTFFDVYRNHFISTHKLYGLWSHTLILMLFLQNDNSVRVYSTTSGRQTQDILHPRPVIDISWRHSPTSGRLVSLPPSTSCYSSA